MCKKGPPAVWTKEKIEEAFAGFVEKNRRLPVAREMKPQYGLPTRRTFERYMDMTAQEYAELRYPTLLSARDERHVQTVLEYRNEVREWSIERLMEAEKNFFTKCGRLPEPYEYTAENGLPMMRSGRPRTTSSGPSPRLQHQGLLSGNSGITLRTL